ncbi:MAG: hypothetical protein CVT83_05880 [Alphaproteobacteria bacterium HGW-Alphaproteobacteria-5]|jgi:hypothetical protein|nr:MAG: hypothetical protein CVT83_05880 [Alphaproteobacteria bacterium HGW-Alphaproteobacteria-5]
MKIRRDVASIPARSAKETWRVITELVTGTGTIDRGQLDAAASIMESLIADEHPAKVPIVFKGAGPRVVIYCLYNEDAMEAGLDVDPLKDNPTAGDWRATAPSEDEDTDWMNKTLKDRAPRITVHDVNQPPEEEEGGKAPQAGADFEIDWGALAKS